MNFKDHLQQKVIDDTLTIIKDQPKFTTIDLNYYTPNDQRCDFGCTPDIFPDNYCILATECIKDVLKQHGQEKNFKIKCYKTTFLRNFTGSVDITNINYREKSKWI